MAGGTRRVLVTIFLAALAVACGPGGTRSGPAAADPDEVLLDRGYGKRLVALEVRTCATRELPIIGREPVAFTRDHKTVATMRRVEGGTGPALPSRLSVGRASEDERPTVWTVGNSADGGMAFDPSGTRIALSLQRTVDRGGNVAPDAVDDGLWIVSRSGDGKRHLVPGRLGLTATFAWSPDGQQIASATADLSPDGSSSSTVWTVDVESGQQRIVTTVEQSLGAGGVVDWSPDGQHILLFTGPTDPSRSPAATNLEEIGVTDGRRTPLLSVAVGDSYGGAVYSADGATIIAQRSHLPPDPPSPPGGPSVTIPMDAPNRRTADLVSVRTNGTGFHSLCPIDPDDTLLDWH